jgi:hypothetical protein
VKKLVLRCHSVVQLTGMDFTFFFSFFEVDAFEA